jgi:hypothetical protein
VKQLAGEGYRRSSGGTLSSMRGSLAMHRIRQAGRRDNSVSGLRITGSAKLVEGATPGSQPCSACNDFFTTKQNDDVFTFSQSIDSLKDRILVDESKQPSHCSASTSQILVAPSHWQNSFEAPSPFVTDISSIKVFLGPGLSAVKSTPLVVSLHCFSFLPPRSRPLPDLPSTTALDSHVFKRQRNPQFPPRHGVHLWPPPTFDSF